MRLHEFTDPSKYFPSKIEATTPAEYPERNPLHNIERDAAHQDTKHPSPKNSSENMMK
jgi:hypothetical protein